MMKRSLFLVCLLLAFNAFGAMHVRWNFQDLTSYPEGVKTVLLEPLSTPAINQTTNVVSLSPRRFTTFSGGYLIVSNVFVNVSPSTNPTDYRVTLYGGPGNTVLTVFTNNFPADTSGLVIGSSATYIAPSAVPSGDFVSYSQNQANALFYPKTTNPSNYLTSAGSVSIATNVYDVTGREMRGAFLEPIDTNHIYLSEIMNTNVGSMMLLQDNAGYAGRYKRSGTVFVPESSPTLAVIYKTNLGVGVWVLVDLAETFGFGPTPIFWMTNWDNSLTVPLGAPWYSDADSIDAISGFSTKLLSHAVLQPTNTVSVAQSSHTAIQHHNSPLNTGIRGGRPVVMIVAGNSGELTSAVELTNVFRFLTNNSLESFPDIVEVDNGIGLYRDANQNLVFTNTYMAGFTNIRDFTSYVHSQGKLAAMHFDSGLWSSVGSGQRVGSQPFYHQDATNAISQGLDGCILDTSIPPWQDDGTPTTADMEFVNELHAAAGYYGRPFYLMGAFNARSPSVFQDWMPSANAYCLNTDSATDAGLRRALKSSSSWRGFGKYLTPANTEDSPFTGSADGARNLFGLMAIGPFNLQCGTNTFTASVRAVCTNSEMKAIWFDAACNPGWLVQSNATGEVWTRLLANGDYAVLFDNISGSAASMSVHWRGLGIETNLTLVCRDVFEQTNISANTSLTTTVPKSSLWRFSFQPLKMSGSGSPEGAVHGTVGSQYARTDGAGGLYIKTNGVGNTGWYNLLTHGP